MAAQVVEITTDNFQGTVLENENAGDALEQPFLKRLAERGAYFTAWSAITHPSQPNYIAMTAGDMK